MSPIYRYVMRIETVVIEEHPFKPEFVYNVRGMCVNSAISRFGFQVIRMLMRVYFHIWRSTNEDCLQYCSVCKSRYSYSVPYIHSASILLSLDVLSDSPNRFLKARYSLLRFSLLLILFTSFLGVFFSFDTRARGSQSFFRPTYLLQSSLERNNKSFIL